MANWRKHFDDLEFVLLLSRCWIFSEAMVGVVQDTYQLVFWPTTPVAPG